MSTIGYSQYCVSIRVSTTNTNDVLKDFYPSLELGRTFGFTSASLVIGRNNLNFDENQPYFYELKFSQSYALTQSYPLRDINIFVLLGGGKFFTNKDYFIEYGFGLSRTVSNYTVALSYSNWNGVNYITPSVGYNF